MRSRPPRSLARRVALLGIVATLAAPALPGPAVAAATPGAARAAAASSSGPAAAVSSTGPAAAGPRVTLRGTVHEVIGDDFRHGRSAVSWFLRTAGGRVPLVVEPDTLRGLNAREAVLDGERLPDGSLRVERAAPALDPASPTSGAPAITGGPPSGAPQLGEAAWSGPATRRIAVIAATYTDLPEPPGVIANLAPALTGATGSIRSLFQAASRGRVTVDADTFGPWPLGFNSCAVANTFTSTIDAVEVQAAAHGVDLARYDDVIMWTPPPCGSNWVALGEAPGTYIQVGAPYPDTLDSRDHEFAWTTSHEMGHNLGLMHANALRCTSGATQVSFAAPASCTSLEYGDPFSTMGGGQGYSTGSGWAFLSPLFDAGELDRLGWLDPDEVQVATAGGTYNLVPVYGAADGVRLLRIRRAAPALASDAGLSYWTLRSGWLEIELRGASPDGTWDTIPTPSPVPVGVIVRYVEDGFAWNDVGSSPQDGPSYLVDAHPATGWTRMDDPGLLDAPLAPGSPVSITDSAGATIATVSATGSGASVSLAFSAAPPAATVFTAATITSAVAGNASATVSWAAPVAPQGRSVTGYTVRSYPGGRECYALAAWPASCTVTGLANETAYRFTVTTAFSPGGYWTTSDPSDPVTPVAPPAATVKALSRYRATQAIAVAWTGTYRGAPADAVDVRYRVAAWSGAFGTTATWQAGATTSGATFTGSPGRTYCFSARAYAAAGGWGPWGAEACAAVPLDDRSLARSAGWTQLSGAAWYRGTAVRSSTAGRSLTRTGAKGRYLALVASTCPTCGSLKVYWNGVYQRTVSLRSTTAKDRAILGLLAFTSVRTGTLKLVVAASGKRVQVDGVLITQK